MPRLKTISHRTLLTARYRLPLRPDDQIEHVLERFRVPLHASRVRKGSCSLMRGNLVLWFLSGQLNSPRLTASLPTSWTGVGSTGRAMAMVC